MIVTLGISLLAGIITGWCVRGLMEAEQEAGPAGLSSKRLPFGGQIINPHVHEPCHTAGTTGPRPPQT